MASIVGFAAVIGCFAFSPTARAALLGPQPSGVGECQDVYTSFTDMGSGPRCYGLLASSVDIGSVSAVFTFTTSGAALNSVCPSFQIDLSMYFNCFLTSPGTYTATFCFVSPNLFVPEFEALVSESEPMPGDSLQVVIVPSPPGPCNTFQQVAPFPTAPTPTSTPTLTSLPSTPPLPTPTLAPTPAPSPTYPSQSCSGGTSIVNGFAGNTSVQVETGPPSLATQSVCLRVDNGSNIAYGGQFVVTGPPGGSPVSWTTDSNASSCLSSGGLGVAGNLGDPGSPDYLPYVIAEYAGSGTAWVCVEVGSVATRAIVTYSPPGTPTVTFNPDSGPSLQPSVPAANTNPSQYCQQAAGTRYVDATAVNGQRAYLYSAQPASGETDVCVGTTGGFANAGGRLVVVGGTLPAVVTSSADTTPCTSNVINNTNPVTVHIWTSPPSGGAPLSLCADVAGTQERVTVTPGSGQNVYWFPDPGTP